MKFELVKDWKSAWRWISVNCMVFAGTLQATWMAIPDDLRDDVPHRLVSSITVALLALGLAGRLYKQKPPKKKKVKK